MRGDVTPDTIVDGRYRIQERLGAGGMAAVYRAQDLQLGREVALKLLYRRFAEDESFVERFRREASAAAGLQHPNVVSVYDRGEWDGTSYIAMELVTGRTLRDLVQEEGPLDPVRAIDCTIGVLRAARFAHRRGIIHRDLKPHNVLVDGEGRTKVTDFGIARAGASDMTETGSIMGTAQYLSPEQAQGLAVTPRSDLYAIGVLLYELLVGRPPFEGDTAVSIALKQVSEPPVPPGRVAPGIPAELDGVVLHALAKDPEQRFADADEFIAALEEVRALITGDGTGGFVSRNGTGSHAAPAPLAPPRRRRWPIMLLLLLALVGAGVAVAAATGVFSSAEQRRVPDVVGKTRDEATQILQDAGFEVRAVRRRSVRPRDTVTSQRPGAGATADEGSTVEMTVSNGPGIDEVPEVEGMPRSEAIDALEKAGFEVREERESSDSIGENRAIETDPPARTQLEGGQTVTLVISSGKPRVPVPNVVGQTQREATRRLEGAGFEVAVDRSENANVDEGTVLAQDPSQGRLREGQTVRIVVAVEPERVTVPSVGGSSLEQATAALRGLGLRVSSTEQPVTDGAQVGTVINQDPAPGTEVERGDTVNLVVGRQADQGDGGDDGGDQGFEPEGDQDGGQGGRQGQGPQNQGPPGQGDGTG